MSTPAARRPDTRHVDDVASLKAIAHPLRVRLLGALRADGPATASELGRRFGESSGSTSYHLRQLARYGFITDASEQPNARDRRWRAAHRYSSWSETDFTGDPDGAEAARWMREHQRDRAAQVAEAFETGDWPTEWRAVAGQSDLMLRLTPESVRELADSFTELAEQLASRDAAAASAEKVALFLAGFPVKDDAP